MKEQKTYYYSDELNDEFSEAKIEARVIDENYKYLHKNIFWNLAHFLVQNVLSVPLKVLYAKLKFRIKYVGKEKLKKYKKQGYFIYGNHTQPVGDAIMPRYVINKRFNTIAGEANLGIPVIRKFFTNVSSFNNSRKN